MMTHERRALLLAVYDGNENVLHYLHMIDSMKRADEILSSLIRNKLTGRRFEDWIANECLKFNHVDQTAVMSLEAFYSKLIAYVEKEKAVRKLNLKRDFV